MTHGHGTDRQFAIQLQPAEWALASYYAHRRHKDRDGVVGGMISRYANADHGFDPKEFIAYVRNELLKDEEEQSVRDLVLRQAVSYAHGRHLADEPTATLAEAPNKKHERSSR